MKEETLEEAAHEYFKRGQLGFEKAADTEEAFLRGGLWQSERMYSEEEVGELVYNIMGEYGKLCGIILNGEKINELFEQFKKKT
ncbi:MAG: hypothetical protein NTY55_02800 [Flavobacteriia bacterium]|nr:hypothetical protein [Flavobacteriia bacterium]